MTSALATRADQARHYAAVRARLWPVVRPEPVSAPKPEWRAPKITPVYLHDDDRIAAILIECKRRKVLNARIIVDITSEVFDVPVTDITGASRHDEHARPRLIAMVIARLLLAGRPLGTLVALASAFDRDHTSIVHACKKYAAAISRVRDKITSPSEIT